MRRARTVIRLPLRRQDLEFTAAAISFRVLVYLLVRRAPAFKKHSHINYLELKMVSGGPTNHFRLSDAKQENPIPRYFRRGNSPNLSLRAAV